MLVTRSAIFRDAVPSDDGLMSDDDGTGKTGFFILGLWAENQMSKDDDGKTGFCILGFWAETQ